MNFILQNWEIIMAIIGPIAGWCGNRAYKKNQLKKEKAQTTEVELNTISTNFKVYQDLINDLESRFKSRIEELELDLAKMKTLNKELRTAISDQETYIKKLKKKLEEYEKLE